MRVLLIDSTSRRETIRQHLDSLRIDLDIDAWAQCFDDAGNARTEWPPDTSVFLIHLTDYWSFDSKMADMTAIDAALRISDATVILYSGGGLNSFEDKGVVTITDDERRRYVVSVGSDRVHVLHDAVVVGNEPDWIAVIERSGDVEWSLAIAILRQGHIKNEAVERLGLWTDSELLLRTMTDMFPNVEIEPLRSAGDLRYLVAAGTGPLDVVALMPRATPSDCVRWIHLLERAGWEGRCVAIVPPAAIEALPDTTLWGDGKSPTLDKLPGFSWLTIPPDMTLLIPLLDQTRILYRELWLAIRRGAETIRLGTRLRQRGDRPSAETMSELTTDLRRIEWDRILSHGDARAMRDAIDASDVHKIVALMERYNLIA